jgi:hypothetical protein
MHRFRGTTPHRRDCEFRFAAAISHFVIGRREPEVNPTGRGLRLSLRRGWVSTQRGGGPGARKRREYGCTADHRLVLSRLLCLSHLRLICRRRTAAGFRLSAGTCCHSPFPECHLSPLRAPVNRRSALCRRAGVATTNASYETAPQIVQLGAPESDAPVVEPPVVGPRPPSPQTKPLSHRWGALGGPGRTDCGVQE